MGNHRPRWVCGVQGCGCCRACQQAAQVRLPESICWVVTQRGERGSEPPGSVLAQRLHAVAGSSPLPTLACGKAGWGQEEGNPGEMVALVLESERHWKIWAFGLAPPLSSWSPCARPIAHLSLSSSPAN